jgi:DNA-binding transcriptional LysR family regulator
MESSEIEAFLALAEELHFGRTAERLRLSQSRVSRLIASLERRVGGLLFERTSRQVTLTRLGKQLRDRADPAWTELESAFAEARDAARNTGGTLRLGCVVSASGLALSRLAELFGAHHPECELVICDMPATDPYGPLRRGEIDVLVYWLVGEEPDLTAGPVIGYRARALAVGLGHRLAGRKSVSVEDLADEETDGKPPSFPAAIFDALTPPRTPSGRVIRRVDPARGMEEVATIVAQGQIVHLTLVDVSTFLRPDLRLVPVEDLPPMPLGLIWRTADENARIRALAGVARQIGPFSASPRQAARDTRATGARGAAVT